MNDSCLNLLLLGDSELDDFRPVVQFLHSHGAIKTERRTADVSGLRQTIERDGWYPDLVVACEAWPDRFSEAAVLELLALCPLARIVCCFGPWCDSAGRTRSIWPLALRVPVAASQPRIEREIAMLENDRSPSRPLPLTASRAEIFEFDFGPSEISTPPGTTAKVVSPDRRWREMLQAALAKHGCRVDYAGDSSAADVVLYDADPWDAVRETDLSLVHTKHPQARLIACAGFPRSDFYANLLRAGAHEIWFKLAPLDELVRLCHPS